jgi:hypothetical protein
MITDDPLPLSPGVTNRGLIAAAMLASVILVLGLAGSLIGGLALLSHSLPEERPQPRYHLTFENTLLVDTMTGEVFKIEPTPGGRPGEGRWVRQIAPLEPTAKGKH